MLTLLGRSLLSFPLRLSPVYPMIYPVGSGYCNHAGCRFHSSNGGSNYEDASPAPPIILYTHGIRGNQEEGSHMGIGIYSVQTDEDLRISFRRKEKETIGNEKRPELHAIYFALFYLYQSPSFIDEDVIIRTHFDPIVNEFEKWRNGDIEGARGLIDTWKQMDKFTNVRIERVDMKDGGLHMAIGLAIIALEEAETMRTKVQRRTKGERREKFVCAKEAEERQLRALDRHDGKFALEEAQKARETLANMRSLRMDFLRSLPAHQRPYTTEAVLARIVSRGVDCLEKTKDHAAACNWIKFIIRNQVLSSLVPHSIGALYERLALDLHHHCGETEEAIDEIKRALEDPLVPDKHRLNLDDRAKRILKEEWKSKFTLTPPAEIVIEGETIGRDLGSDRKNLFVKKSKDGDIEQISVERVALDYFLSQGMEEGLHSEGEIWHLAFKLLFWDVIYGHRVDGVWMCELQATPLDHDHSLYAARKETFEERFQWLRTSSECDRHSKVEENWHGTETISMGEMKSFLTACSLPTLMGVMEILAKEPRHRRSGFPDLVLWNAKKRVITVAEVKGPGDTLSTKQRLWLDFFMKEDNERVKAYLCKVTASGRKRLQ